MKASVKIVVVLLVLVIAAGAGFYGYRQAIKPRLERNGGTILIYEVDGEPPPGFQPAALAEALQRRLDRSGQADVTVQPIGPTRVEVRVPRAGDHQAQMQIIRALVAQSGALPAPLKPVPVSEVYIYPKL